MQLYNVTTDFGKSKSYIVWRLQVINHSWNNDTHNCLTVNLLILTYTYLAKSAKCSYPDGIKCAERLNSLGVEVWKLGSATCDKVANLQ